MPINKIVVATDFSEHADAAGRRAAAIARRNNAAIELIHVDRVLERALDLSPRLEDMSAELERIRAQRNDSLIDRLERQRRDLEALGVAAAARLVHGYPDEVIPEAARDADLLVLGTHGYSGMQRILLGSVAEQIVRRSGGNILVVRDSPKTEFRKVLAAIDFSEYTRPTIELAIALTDESRSLELFHTWHLHSIGGTDEVWESEWVELRNSVAESCAERGGALARGLTLKGIEATYEQREARPRHGIEQRAREGNFDLVVTGSHGRRGFKRWVLGSVAEMTVRHAPCSVAVAHLPSTTG